MDIDLIHIYKIYRRKISIFIFIKQLKVIPKQKYQGYFRKQIPSFFYKTNTIPVEFF